MNLSYSVKSGDTLYGIANTYHTNVTDLKSLNGLSSDLIRIGQLLKIPSTTSTPAPVVSTASKVQAVISEAQKYIGTPYLWGGTTPAGFDCSGFVNYVFNKVGVSLPRTVASQWTATDPVSAPSPGDIVYFETYQTGPSHNGIYIGNNKFIHAGSSGVTTSDLTTTYWKTKYLGARSSTLIDSVK
ncbi:C40 family peptidase [Bacillus sp. EB600]|uniref:C40 family peptidase n=1 Tax=Bacillus sp. EB600 TaxID=2806345 RepID=UPI00210D530F|nr:LysM peptidoglycan-binding domain-containing C40 family peptidase [Bacillus sp. EB600]MCQ6279179.1 peptidoglycan endopeptidase [Bacillus sp. EB600]